MGLEPISAVNMAYMAPPPNRSPWDRGAHYVRLPGREEGMAAMMARLTAKTKIIWTTPAIDERRVCDNCDGAPDGGHADDALCRRTLEEA